MADHLRNQIRDRVVASLTGLTTTGSNVYQTPMLTAEEQTLPGLVVYIDSEISGETATMTNINRECVLHIDGYVEASASVLDTLESTDIEITSSETRPLGIVSMAYFVQYRTSFSAPDVVV